MMMNLKRFGKNRSWSNRDTILAFALRDWGIQQNPVRIAGVPAGVRNNYLSNTSLECYLWTSGIQPGVRVPPGYVKLNIYILFHDKHWIIRARFRVSHGRPGCKAIRFGNAISLSLSLSLSSPPSCDYYLSGYFHFTPRSALERDWFLILFFI
jgi:hypothetical protein